MKALKFIAIAAAPIILIVGVWMFVKSGGNELPTDYLYADVVTGEVLSFARGEIKSFPIKNKRDGKRTIYPVTKTPDGKYIIEERYRQTLLDSAGNLGTLKVDTQSFELKR